MKLDNMFPPKYLRPQDLNKPVRVTISAVTKEKPSGMSKEPEYALWCKGATRPIKLTKATASSIAKVLNSDDTDEWINREVILYTEVTKFNTVGIRARKVEVKDEQQ